MIAILDACGLYPAPLRDFLMHLTLLGAFKARWTERIHDEWIRNVLEMRPDLTSRQLRRTRDLMNLFAQDCLVENYERFIDEVDLPDPNDRHVLAAAIHCQAEAIVTFNLRDFPESALKGYGMKAISPDEFVIELSGRYRERIQLAFERQLASLKNPP